MRREVRKVQNINNEERSKENTEYKQWGEVRKIQNINNEERSKENTEYNQWGEK